MSHEDLAKALGQTEDIDPPAPKPNGASDTAPKFTKKEWDEIKHLLALSPLERDRQIKPTADKLGCLVSTLRQIIRGMLCDSNGDEAGNGHAGNKPGAGQALHIPELVPWGGPVDGASLLDELAATVRRYVVAPDGVPEAVALWTVHTHAIDAAFISARLAITSPERRCGKTTLLILLSALVARPLSTANITAAGIFRIVDAVHPTLLVDEADSFLSGNEELRGLINAGHCRANSTVYRVIELPEGHDTRGFDVWGPIAIAAIGKLPATIEDRSVKIPLQRCRRDEEVERLRLDRLAEFVPLASRCVRWTRDYLPRLRGADPPLPKSLHSRAADNWRALLAIADVAGGAWPEKARRATQLLSVAGFEDGESRREMLLADLKALFDADTDPSGALFTDDILAKLGAMELRPWPEYRAGKPITSPQLAALLRPVHVLPNTVRRGTITKKGYRREDLEDPFRRYLSTPSAKG
jgi:hypothetical protein